MTERFKGQVALVTAAAAGIGAATAEMFARQGARVMLSDIDSEGGERLAEKLRQDGFQARFLHADATVEDDVERLVRKTVETFGGLHLAGNIVGDAHPQASGAEFHTQTLESWEHTMAVSLRSVFLSMKHEVAHMIGNDGGSIVNVTSLAALLYVGVSGAAYAASKAGVIRLSKFAAVTYADRGIRVNCIAPGVTPTAAYNKAGEEIGMQVVADLIQNQPIRRAIKTSEQADAIGWLCSKEASMVTGHVLPIDGGWTAR